MGQSVVEGEIPNSALVEEGNQCQVSCSYGSGVCNLAWAQAVRNKPDSDKNEFDDSEADNGGGVNSFWNGKVVIDLSSGDDDDGDGDDLSSDSDVNKLDNDLKGSNKELEHRVGDIRLALECVIRSDPEESYDAVCYRIRNSLDSLWEVVLEDFGSKTDDLVELAYGALKNLNNMFVSMNRNKQEEYKHSLSRLLLHVTSQNPPLFATDQMKEIEHMIKSLESGSPLPFLRDTDNQNKKENDEEVKVLIDLTKLETDITELETNSFRDKGQLLPPFLDPHKDHDKDNLPSPTRDAPSTMPPGNPANLGWPEPPAPRGEDDVVMPYYQNALKAFSTYQKKFGQTSLHTNDLPSPTPSEDGDDEIDDTCGVAKTINAPSFPQLNVSSSNGNDTLSGKVVENSRDTVKAISLAKNRDPRLRDAVVSNGPILKKQKNGPTDFGGSIKNMVTDGFENLPEDSIRNTVPLESIIKDIAVNPVAWLDRIIVEQHKILSSSNSGRRETPPLNVTKSSTVENKLDGILKTPLQKPSTNMQVKSEKSRVKPCDPPRTVHRNKVQNDGNGDPNRIKLSSPSISSSHKTRVRLNSSNLPDKKLPPLKNKTAPHTTQKFIKNLKKDAPPQDEQEIVNNQSGTISSSDEVSDGPSRAQNPWGEVEHLFEGFDEREKADFHQERARRIDEQKKMLAAHKLCLVLDLDHTLLNSARFVEVDPVHNELLRKKEEQDREKPYRHLFRIPHMGMWTKLRPGIWNFLKKASKLFELHVYTMGNKMYATEMTKLLDPDGTLFSGRVISRGDDDDDGDISKIKDLEGVLGLESGVVIIDDSIRVWPHNKLNLIVVERYIYFPCSRRQFGLSGPSLLEIDHDEKPKAGTLASSLAVIERIHKKFFAHGSLDEVDVRNILASEQRKILRGCRIVFSRVIPIGVANPNRHPIWQMAQQFGATCTNHIDEKVTHVVANSLGTDKVKWARATGRFVVNPGWVEASALLYRRANEQDFAIKP